MIIGNWIIDDEWKIESVERTTYYSRTFDTIDRKYALITWSPSIFFRNKTNIINFSIELESFQDAYIQMFGGKFHMNSVTEAQERVDLFLLKLSKLKAFI
jgi:hypothetical protein